MKLRRLAVMALLGAACTTTAVGRAGAQNAQARLAQDAPSEVSTATTDRGPDQPAVAITATSATNVQFRPDARDTVVPLTPVHPRAAVNHRSPALYGFLIGVAGGVLLGSAKDRAANDRAAQGDPDAKCCGSAVIPGALILGLIGLGVGALVGAISGPGDSP